MRGDLSNRDIKNDLESPLKVTDTLDINIHYDINNYVNAALGCECLSSATSAEDCVPQRYIS